MGKLLHADLVCNYEGDPGGYQKFDEPGVCCPCTCMHGDKQNYTCT